MPRLSKKELKAFLDEKYEAYNNRTFIEADPISIPHRFSRKADIEIAGFLTATIAWGQRPTIIRNSERLMDLMGNAPYEFLLESGPEDLKPFRYFQHRTFNGTDTLHFLKALKHIYETYEDMEAVFHDHLRPGDTNLRNAITGFRKVFFSFPHEKRTEKHVANPEMGSSAKRLNMFLRWMVRPGGVDFDLWTSLPTSLLSCPLDVHSGQVARKLGLLKRKQNDWKAVEELDRSLRRLDPEDPVKYDLALFGLGAFEKF